jgi:LEA14-like dessication related protein
MTTDIMKKVFRIAGIILLLLIVAAVILVLLNPKKIVGYIVPEIKQVNEINIVLKGDMAYLNSKLTVKNKSIFNIAIDSIKYNIELMGKEYIQSEKYLGLKLKPAMVDTIDFSITVPYKEILHDLKEERKKGDSTDYTINVSLIYSTVFGNAVLPYKKTDFVTIPKPPELEIVHVHYHKVRLTHFSADVNVKLINPNNLDMTIKQFNYDIDISKRGNIVGSYLEPIHIKPKSETLVILPIEVEMKHIAKTLYDVITNQDNYDYVLKLDALVESPDPQQEPIHINLYKAGKMELKE